MWLERAYPAKAPAEFVVSVKPLMQTTILAPPTLAHRAAKSLNCAPPLPPDGFTVSFRRLCSAAGNSGIQFVIVSPFVHSKASPVAPAGKRNQPGERVAAICWKLVSQYSTASVSISVQKPANPLLSGVEFVVEMDTTTLVSAGARRSGPSQSPIARIKEMETSDLRIFDLKSAAACGRAQTGRRSEPMNHTPFEPASKGRSRMRLMAGYLPDAEYPDARIMAMQ